MANGLLLLFLEVGVVAAVVWEGAEVWCWVVEVVRRSRERGLKY